MTQQKLREEIEEALPTIMRPSVDIPAVLKIVNKHVAEVIGEDEPPGIIGSPKNMLRAEQRKRAGL